ncbi:MAG: hypothetical protein SVR08_02045 [Spirochaetota bacterium]|nr:hypothetical protein [Spirochaetota bacterium]
MADETTKSDIINQVKGVIESSNYTIEEPEIAKEFMGKPDIYGKNGDQEFCGLIADSLKGLERSITHLWTIKQQIGRQADYFIGIPALGEDKLLEFLSNDNKKWFKKIRREKFQIWMCNPNEKNITCVYSAPKDDNITKNITVKPLDIE